jgi:hypothetical protein
LLRNDDTTSAISSFIWHTSAALLEDRRISHASFPISERRRSVGGLVFVKTIHLGYDRCLVQRAVEYIVKMVLCKHSLFFVSDLKLSNWRSIPGIERQTVCRNVRGNLVQAFQYQRLPDIYRFYFAKLPCTAQYAFY